MTRRNTGESSAGGNLFRLLIEKSPEQIWLVGRDGSILYANPASAEFLGATPRERYGRTFLEQFHPEDIPQAACVLQKLLENPGRTITAQLRARHLAAGWLWIECCITNLLSNPDVQALVVNSRNITERKEAENELRMSEARFRTIFEESPLGIVIADSECRFIQVNPAFCRQIGYSSEELLEMTFLDTTHPEDRGKSLKAASDILKGARKVLTFEKRHITKAGEEIEVRITTTLFGRGEGIAPAMLSIIENLAEKWQAQGVLQNSERACRLLFELNPQPILVFERETLRVLAANPAATRVYGCSERELLSLSLRDIWKPGEGAAVATHQLQYDGAQAGLWLIPDPAGRHQLEDGLHHAGQMEALGLLASGIGHDFNNLLAVVNGYCARLLARVDHGDPIRDDIQQIASAGERAAGLTGQLLALGREPVPQPRIVNLNDVIGAVNKFLPLLVGGGVEIHIDLNPKLQCVLADPSQWERVVMNLAINSSDAMPGGGRLEIKTSNVPPRAELAEGEDAGAAPGAEVMLAVSDRGAGMDRAALSHIFEPFFTTKEAGKGTGLGLATVAAIVKQSGGSMVVESEPGKGTTFRIYLPRAQDFGSANKNG